jgi:hypothetical protein
MADRWASQAAPNASTHVDATVARDQQIALAREAARAAAEKQGQQGDGLGGLVSTFGQWMNDFWDTNGVPQTVARTLSPTAPLAGNVLKFVGDTVMPAAGNIADRGWTDDFSAIPVIGPASSALASTYMDSVNGLAQGASAAALAANPKYWQNRGPDDDLWANARDVSPGRAITALGSVNPFGDSVGADLPGPKDVYQENPDFNIADQAQRDAMFENNAALKITSGTFDGISTFYLDPLVIGGKFVKVARFGSESIPGGFKFAGLTNRTLIDSKGVRLKTIDALEQEADEAIKFARGQGGSEQPIGVLGDTVAKGNFESLLNFNPFKGASRDPLAAAGAAITNKVDAITFLAAAAGVPKYQALLSERAPAIYAGLQRSAKSAYEEALLNTPLGTQTRAVLPEFLEKDFSVKTLIDDLATRDPELNAVLRDDALRAQGLLIARDTIESGDAFRLERIGGTNVTGMKIAQAWREGREARAYAGSDYLKGRKPRFTDGTGPAAFERVFQASSILPKTRVWDWVRGSHASGYLDIRGYNVGKSSDELRAALSDSRTLRKDKDFIAEAMQRYGAAMTPTDRMDAIRWIEREATKRLAAKASEMAGTKIDSQRIDEVYSIIDKRRSDVVGNFQKQVYGVDPLTGDPIITGALLRSQLETSMPMLNMRMLEKTVAIAARPQYANYGADAGKGTQFLEASKALADEIQSIWKAGVLLRLGYTVRNTGEGWLRSAAFLGTVPAISAAPRGFMNSFYNNSRRVQGLGLVGPSLRRLKVDESAAVDRVNEMSKNLDSLRVQRDEALAADPTVGVTKFDSQINNHENQINSLMDSLAQIRAKRTNLESRRAVGDSGAFGGELNSDHADLLRRLSSSDQTTRTFLESSWERGQQEYLSQSAWAKIKPDSPQYWQELSNAVRQFRNDDVTRKILNDESVGDIVNWLKSKEGTDYRRTMRVSKDAAEQRVVELQAMVQAYLPTAEVRAMAAASLPDSNQLRAVLGHLENAPKPPKAPTRDNYQTDAAFLKAQAKYDAKLDAYKNAMDSTPQLRPIHGREVAAQLGGAENAYYQLRKQTIDRVFKLIGTDAESTLVRHPFYAETWKRYFDGQLKLAQHQGREINEEMLKGINNGAHRFAMRSTNETLYTIERYSNLASVFRWAAPFFAAWENSFKVWTRLIANDPSILGRANILWNIPNQLGMVVDDKGNPVERENFSFLNPGAARFVVLPSAMNDWVRKVSGGTDIKIPQGALNIVTPGETPYLPGFGPTITYPAGVFLATRPDIQNELRLAFGDSLYNQIAPFGVPQDDLVASFAPPWARKLIENVRGESDQNYLRVTGAMWQNAMVEWYQSGGHPEDKPNADVIMQRAHDFYRFSILSSLTLPFATTRMSPYQTQVDYWNNLKADPSMTYAEKVDTFIRKWGDSYAPLLTSTSKTEVPGVDPTIEDYRILTENSDLARQLSSLDPTAAGIIAQSAPIGAFDKGVYKWLSENNVPGADGALRGARSVNEMGEAITMQAAWRDYRQSKAVLEEEMKRMGVKSLQDSKATGLKAAWEQYVKGDMVKQYGEQWVVNFNDYSAKSATYLVGIQTALGNKKFMDKVGNTPLWQQIDDYMKSRQIAIDYMKQNPKEAKRVRDSFNAWAAEAKYSSLAFSDFYDKFLDQDPVTEIGLESLGI